MMDTTQIQALNGTMLGRGCPIQWDGQGYSKVDYDYMAFLYEKRELTEVEQERIVTTLLKYKKTQLNEYASELEETATTLRNKVKRVNVVKFNSKSIHITFAYNKRVSDFVKFDFDKSYYKWHKQDNVWVLEVLWSGMEQLLQVFQDYGFITTEIENAYAHKDEVVVSTPKAKKLVMMVSRPSTTIDTLAIEIPYNKEVINVFHTIDGMTYSKSTKEWSVLIKDAGRLYNALNELGIVDLKALKVWADLVNGWDKEYPLIDYTKLDLPFTPYPFQIDDAKALLKAKTMLNANEVGCGKTFEQILVGESIPMKKLVICPPSLRINWYKEIKMVNPNANINIIYSNAPYKSVEGWNIIGYTTLSKYQKELEREQFQVIMMDEAHFIQAVSNGGTPESKRAYGVLRLVATANYVYPITGTPKTNRNKNIFNILRTIRHPLAIGKYAFSNFGKTYCDGYQGTWGWDYNGNSNDEELFSQISPCMVRHLKRDVLPNITKQRVTFPVEVDLREYNLEIEEYLRTRKNKNAEALARLTKAKQILAIKKADESIDLAGTFVNQEKKVVIVTCFTEVVARVEKAFANNVVKIVGGMTDKQKDNAIDQFQNGEPMVMVINVVAGGVGVTLTKSSTMIINDLPWTTGEVQQAEGRIWRSGQFDQCMIYFTCAVGADMDEYLINMLTYKADTINQAIDGGLGESMDLVKLYEDSLKD